MNKYKNLFKPMTVNGHVFRNRIISLPNKGKPALSGGIPSDMFISYLAEKARGGAAQVTVGDTSVDPEYARGRWAPMSLDRENFGFLCELAFAIKQYGALASMELNHSGSHANPPGRSPLGPVSYVRPDGVRVEAMDEAMMARAAERFAVCAEALKAVGFDGLVIHGAHGWLLGEYLSPLTNRRTDKYGGSLENRARFPIQVVEAVRQAVGRDFLIEYRISGSELLDGGLSIDETTAFIKMIEDKIDLVNVSGGVDTIKSMKIHVTPTYFLPHAYHAGWAAEMKKAVSIPVIALGGINTPELGERILAEGGADFIGMSRALIADPFLPVKARRGEEHRISPCIRCMECLADADVKRVMTCSVNPSVGRELRLKGEYAARPEPRNVLVAGGGIAGLTAACTAADRGHRVTLLERSDRLGGVLNCTDSAPLKSDVTLLKNNLVSRAGRSGIDIRLGTGLSGDIISGLKPDDIIIAAGAEPVVPDIKGIDGPNVRFVGDPGTAELSGGSCVIIGGGLSGCETALELAGRGVHVTVVQRSGRIARDANQMVYEALMQSLRGRDITVMYNTRCPEIRPDGVYTLSSDGSFGFIPADRVLYAVGMRPNSDLFEKYYDAAENVVAVGSCVRPGNILRTIQEAYFAAMNIGT